MSYSYCPRCGDKLETKVFDGKQRPACPDTDCGFVHFDNPTPVVAGIVERDGRVVLVQNEEWPDHWYALVSGFLETGESPEEGIRREIREEIHLEADIESLVGVYPFEMMNQLLVVYHAKVEGAPEIGEELSDLTEVPIDDVQPWEIGTGPALADWLKEQ